MKNIMYIPQQTDVSSVELPKQRSDLVEILAKDVHDTWVVQRITDEWIYDTQR